MVSRSSLQMPVHLNNNLYVTFSGGFFGRHSDMLYETIPLVALNLVNLHSSERQVRHSQFGDGEVREERHARDGSSGAPDAYQPFCAGYLPPITAACGVL